MSVTYLSRNISPRPRRVEVNLLQAPSTYRGPSEPAFPSGSSYAGVKPLGSGRSYTPSRAKPVSRQDAPGRTNTRSRTPTPTSDYNTVDSYLSRDRGISGIVPAGNTSHAKLPYPKSPQYDPMFTSLKQRLGDSSGTSALSPSAYSGSLSQTAPLSLSRLLDSRPSTFGLTNGSSSCASSNTVSNHSYRQHPSDMSINSSQISAGTPHADLTDVLSDTKSTLGLGDTGKRRQPIRNTDDVEEKSSSPCFRSAASNLSLPASSERRRSIGETIKRPLGRNRERDYCTLENKSHDTDNEDEAKTDKRIPNTTSVLDQDRSDRIASEFSPKASNFKQNPRALVGLNNLGNTCFMNTCIQCLSSSIHLTSFFLSNKHVEELNKTNNTKGALAKVFGELIKKLWQGSPMTSISPTSFKSDVGRWAPRFMGYSQQDCQEFLRFVLDGLHEDLNRIKTKPPVPSQEEVDLEDSLPDERKADCSWRRFVARNDSYIIDLFCGQLKSTIRCSKCENLSVTFDPFLDLSVPIPKKPLIRGHSLDDPSPTLEDCLRSFTEEECLQGDEAYHCSKCRSPETAYKRLRIHRFPKLLVIHIKRFSYSFSYRDKLTSNINFPLQDLDLAEFATESGPVLYDLFAVSNHVGSLAGGHYFAYCLNPDDRQWYSFNDSTVSLTNPSSIRSPAAYLLFYQRRNANSPTTLPQHF